MKLVLDANALIYLAKSNLLEQFINLTKNDILIDTHVYEEAVEHGIRLNYPDAMEIKDFLERHRIPIIPLDISGHINKFRDPGESSCYIICKDKDGLCITSDIRAAKKLKKNNIDSIQLDTYFFRKCKENLISPNEFIHYLEDLRAVNATTGARMAVFIELLNRGDKS